MAFATSLPDSTTNPYGVQQVNGVTDDLGQPELVKLLLNLYETRVGTLPWVPSDWLAKVRGFQFGYPDRLIVMRVTARSDDPSNAPFLDTEAKRSAWAEIAQEANRAKVDFIAGSAQAGRERLAKLTAAAAKWDGWAKIAEGIAGGFFSGIRALVILAALGGLAYVYITHPEPINRFFGNMFKGKGKGRVK